MDYDLTRIEFFQFNNLLQNRVPFLLFHDGINFSELFGPLERMHLERWAVQVDFSAPLEAMEAIVVERTFPKSVPIVLFSKAGDPLEGWITKFNEAGYPNVCWVVGSWSAMKEVASRS